MKSLLPDRERRHLLQFYVLPKLSYRPRLAWAGGLILTGLVIQLGWPATSVATMLFATVPILCAGNALLLVKGYNLAPSYGVTGGTWEKTTRDRFQEIRRLQDAVATWDQTFADVTCVLGVASIVLIVVVVGGVTAAMAANQYTLVWAPVFAIDAAILILPHWISGTRRGWRPVALREQVDALEVALQTIESYEEPPCQIQPMFEVAGPDKSQTPIGARVFIRFPDGPDDFLGLQYQVAINDVQGTKYPYLYAVLVARKSFHLLAEPYARYRRQFEKPGDSGGLLGFLGIAGKKDRLTIEGSRESDVDVIIVRQHTTKKTGYHTAPAAIATLARITWKMASELASEGVRQEA